MKKLLYFLLFEMIFIVNIKAQHSVIQSIDFDSEGRTVYSLTGFYDYSYVFRYDNGKLETWNLTQLFNLPFLWISSTIDNDGNIWAFQTAWLYKFDGTNWSVFNIPYSYSSYQKITHIETDNLNNIWISPFYEDYVFKLSHTDTTWKSYSIPHSTTEYCLAGEIVFEGDSTWICSSTGLSLIYGDSVSIALDTSNSNIPTEKFYSFYIDTKGNRWLGSYDKGLIKWVNDSTFFRITRVIQIYQTILLMQLPKIQKEHSGWLLIMDLLVSMVIVLHHILICIISQLLLSLSINMIKFGWEL